MIDDAVCVTARRVPLPTLIDEEYGEGVIDGKG
jgi:hypothetical protein